MMADTLQLWTRLQSGVYENYVPETVTQAYEMILSQIQITSITPHVGIESLAQRFIDLNISDNFNECINIAAALSYECDFYVSWNYKHIVNKKTIRGTKIVAMMEDLKDIVICTPTMLIQ